MGHPVILSEVHFFAVHESDGWAKYLQSSMRGTILSDLHKKETEDRANPLATDQNPTWRLATVRSAIKKIIHFNL